MVATLHLVDLDEGLPATDPAVFGRLSSSLPEARRTAPSDTRQSRNPRALFSETGDSSLDNPFTRAAATIAVGSVVDCGSPARWHGSLFLEGDPQNGENCGRGHHQKTTGGSVSKKKGRAS